MPISIPLLSVTSRKSSHSPSTELFIPTISLPDVIVNRATNCPNVNCKINFAHTYCNGVGVPARPPHIPNIKVRRFQDNAHPFPQMNCFEVTDTSGLLLQTGRKAYIWLYGTVHLEEVTLLSPQWRIFKCLQRIDYDDQLVTVIVARKEFCQRHNTWKRYLCCFSAFI
ncbi:hypothetical protein BV22DRAFT_1045647 [Leucogyrophana mollusca]|uniref:Uncharacterized protein n=1 Tax=Leucogyrophana mollusca TaxID=85980 RepID=A0ACB8BP44_9AGAM|nr:hypothetical protein BV22DRAFT_1045647 [Leucogyrophana mollusca]